VPEFQCGRPSFCKFPPAAEARKRAAVLSPFHAARWVFFDQLSWSSRTILFALRRTWTAGCHLQKSICELQTWPAYFVPSHARALHPSELPHAERLLVTIRQILVRR